MWKALAVVLLITGCASGGAEVACEEFVQRDAGDVEVTGIDVEDRGSDVYRVTGTAVGELSEHAFVCQVRDDGDQWVLEQLTYD